MVYLNALCIWLVLASFVSAKPLVLYSSDNIRALTALDKTYRVIGNNLEKINIEDSSGWFVMTCDSLFVEVDKGVSTERIKLHAEIWRIIPVVHCVEGWNYLIEVPVYNNTWNDVKQLFKRENNGNSK